LSISSPYSAVDFAISKSVFPVATTAVPTAAVAVPIAVPTVLKAPFTLSPVVVDLVYNVSTLFPASWQALVNPSIFAEIITFNSSVTFPHLRNYENY